MPSHPEPFSFLNEDLLTPLSGRGRKDGGREESGDAQGSPSGNPQVSPTKPSSVIGSTLARIVRGPGSVPGWGLGNGHHPPCVPRHLKTWGYTPCEDALLRK